MHQDTSTTTAWSIEKARAQHAAERRGEGKQPMSAEAMAEEVDRLRKALVNTDWAALSFYDMANRLMNHFGQSPLFGYHHPLVEVALSRVRDLPLAIERQWKGRTAL